MNDAKYIGLDVHQATISAAVLDSTGKLVMEAILETKAVTVRQFIHGMRGDLHVTFEEGTCAAWLHDLLKPHVTQVLVCDPRKNALLKVGNKSDRIDARKLAELLRSNLLRSVYHQDYGLRTVKELARSYMTKEWRRREKMGYIGPGSHEAIIDENLFKLAKEARSGRVRAVRGGTERSLGLLTGIAKCIRCGSGVGYQKRYHSRSKMNPNWKDTFAFEYICTGYKYKGICSQKVMSGQRLESTVLGHVKNVYAHPKIQERIVYDGKSEEENEGEKKIARVQREIASEKLKIERQTVAYERGIIPVEEHEANMQRIREETKKSRADQDRLSTLSSLTAQHTVATQKLLASLKDFDPLWDEIGTRRAEDDLAQHYQGNPGG